MRLFKKTWCFMRDCKGSMFRELPKEKDLVFRDFCAKCGAMKETMIHTGALAYFDPTGKFIGPKL